MNAVDTIKRLSGYTPKEQRIRKVAADGTLLDTTTQTMLGPMELRDPISPSQVREAQRIRKAAPPQTTPPQTTSQPPTTPGTTKPAVPSQPAATKSAVGQDKPSGFKKTSGEASNGLTEHLKQLLGAWSTLTSGDPKPTSDGKKLTSKQSMDVHKMVIAGHLMDMQKVPDKSPGKTADSPTVVDPKTASDGNVPGTESWEQKNSSKQDNGDKKMKSGLTKESGDKLGAPDDNDFSRRWTGGFMQGRVRKELERELDTGKIDKGTAIPANWIEEFRQRMLQRIEERKKTQGINKQAEDQPPDWLKARAAFPHASGSYGQIQAPPGYFERLQQKQQQTPTRPAAQPSRDDIVGAAAGRAVSTPSASTLPQMQTRPFSDRKPSAAELIKQMDADRQNRARKQFYEDRQRRQEQWNTWQQAQRNKYNDFKRNSAPKIEKNLHNLGSTYRFAPSSEEKNAFRESVLRRRAQQPPKQIPTRPDDQPLNKQAADQVAGAILGGHIGAGYGAGLGALIGTPIGMLYGMYKYRMENKLYGAAVGGLGGLAAGGLAGGAAGAALGGYAGSEAVRGANAEIAARNAEIAAKNEEIKKANSKRAPTVWYNYDGTKTVLN